MLLAVLLSLALPAARGDGPNDYRSCASCAAAGFYWCGLLNYGFGANGVCASTPQDCSSRSGKLCIISRDLAPLCAKVDTCVNPCTTYDASTAPTCCGGVCYAATQANYFFTAAVSFLAAAPPESFPAASVAAVQGAASAIVAACISAGSGGAVSTANAVTLTSVTKSSAAAPLYAPSRRLQAAAADVVLNLSVSLSQQQAQYLGNVNYLSRELYDSFAGAVLGAYPGATNGTLRLSPATFVTPSGTYVSYSTQHASWAAANGAAKALISAAHSAAMALLPTPTPSPSPQASPLASAGGGLCTTTLGSSPTCCGTRCYAEGAAYYYFIATFTGASLTSTPSAALMANLSQALSDSLSSLGGGGAVAARINTITDGAGSRVYTSRRLQASLSVVFTARLTTAQAVLIVAQGSLSASSFTAATNGVLPGVSYSVLPYLPQYTSVAFSVTYDSPQKASDSSPANPAKGPSSSGLASLLTSLLSLADFQNTEGANSRVGGGVAASLVLAAAASLGVLVGAYRRNPCRGTGDADPRAKAWQGRARRSHACLACGVVTGIVGVLAGLAAPAIPWLSYTMMGGQVAVEQTTLASTVSGSGASSTSASPANIANGAILAYIGIVAFFFPAVALASTALFRVVGLLTHGAMPPVAGCCLPGMPAIMALSWVGLILYTAGLGLQVVAWTDARRLLGFPGAGPGLSFLAFAYVMLILATLSFSGVGCCCLGPLPGVGVAKSTGCCPEASQDATPPEGAPAVSSSAPAGLAA